MGMRHINGSDVSPHEIQERKLADELLWFGRLLEHHAGTDPNADRILDVSDTALHYGHTRRPYWRAVEAFEAKHRRELDAILRLDISQILASDFHDRFGQLFLITQRMNTDEPIEQFDVDLRRYQEEIARMIHELKHLVSERTSEPMTLQQARGHAHSSIIARAWDSGGRLALLKQGTTLPIVEDDGSLNGHSKAAVLEVGTPEKEHRQETIATPRWSPLASLLAAKSNSLA
tara:strand:+ start:562 stop:1257 length:696 start_codon:yes stop_codon:yes gene_type:complete